MRDQTFDKTPLKYISLEVFYLKLMNVKKQV